ncbi:TPA: GTPase ObgE [Candidatus Sumerlaeota bacterium]|jgi:GTPase|nr:GTPase ObgE [Candidatus Sumerlaeota bacterium]
MVFVDYLKMHVRAGDGGHGCIAFHREKYVPRGGPDGGDGGRGGTIYFEVDAKLGTLYDLKQHPSIVAKRGGNGGGNNCSGANADDIIIRVPIGTVVSDLEGNQLADLKEPGQVWVAAQGGRGGQGNQHFATSKNKTPRYAQDGEAGQERALTLDLKLIADVGLVGLPNAGKSTLLSKMTAATPKIASYPFTTLSPNLGVLEFDEVSRLTLADIPGLIEGASKGAGLGDRFLRHIERTRVLAHLVGDEEGIFDPDDMLYKYDLVCQELSAYSDKLANKKQIVLVTKIDLAEPEDLEKTLAAFAARGITAHAVSSMSGAGLDQVRDIFRAAADEARKEEAALEAELQKAAHEQEKQARSYTIIPPEEVPDDGIPSE